MNNYGYLVPANAKKALLIFSILRPVDAIILGSGVGISLIALLILGSAETWQLLVACIPMLVCLILVLPIPNYHNTLVAIQSIMRFNRERREYYWKGWCIYDEFK